MKQKSGTQPGQNVERARVRQPNLAAELDFSRKPYAWNDIEPQSLPVEFLASLPAADILGAEPYSDFTAEAPAQYFLARNSAGLFLVNHEGYRYPRYILRVNEATFSAAKGGIR